MKIKLFVLFTLSLLVISCKSSVEFDFEKFCFPDDNEHILYTYGLDNKYYNKLTETNNKCDDFLLSKILSTESTNWKTEFFYRPLTVGDLAIDLLTIRNINKDDEFYLLMPESIKGKYVELGITAWWDWIHESLDNRIFVKKQLESIIFSKR